MTKLDDQNYLDHLRSTQEEAKERRQNKLDNQLKKDTDHLQKVPDDSERNPSYAIQR